MTKNDKKMKKRGELARKLGRYREMMPGYLVERKQKCGKPSCWCAKEEGGHLRYQLTVRLGGKTSTYHVPLKLVEELRSRIEERHEFEQAVEEILSINLENFLKRKQEAADEEKGGRKSTKGKS